MDGRWMELTKGYSWCSNSTLVRSESVLVNKSSSANLNNKLIIPQIVDAIKITATHQSSALCHNTVVYCSKCVFLDDVNRSTLWWHTIAIVFTKLYYICYYIINKWNSCPEYLSGMCTKNIVAVHVLYVYALSIEIQKQLW